ncbi:MAG: Uma2 family endonuclease [Thermomicrobiales bacterium]
MTTLITTPTATKSPGQPYAEIVYPESDGKRMSDNTKQARWIIVLYDNLCDLFQDRADVFVAADNLWYPVQGEEISNAPDVYVVFGRPKGDRGSYKQWLENDIPLTVVFEILSPSNSYQEMADKLDFYAEHGVEEYYIYDPDRNRLEVYRRGMATLAREFPSHGFISPRLGIRFDLSGPEMVVFRPDGKPFRSFELISADLRRAEKRADDERQRADDEKQRADKAEQRAERLAELSRKARRGQASAEELQELEQLENDSVS